MALESEASFRDHGASPGRDHSTGVAREPGKKEEKYPLGARRGICDHPVGLGAREDTHQLALGQGGWILASSGVDGEVHALQLGRKAPSQLDGIVQRRARCGGLGDAGVRKRGVGYELLLTIVSVRRGSGRNNGGDPSTQRDL